MTTDLREQLHALGLRHTADAPDDLVALATKSRWGVQQILEHVARLELDDRARRSPYASGDHCVGFRREGLASASRAR